jgi:hypothetical protein
MRLYITPQMSSRTPGGTRTPGWIPLLYYISRLNLFVRILWLFHLVMKTWSRWHCDHVVSTVTDELLSPGVRSVHYVYESSWQLRHVWHCSAVFHDIWAVSFVGVFGCVKSFGRKEGFYSRCIKYDCDVISCTFPNTIYNAACPVLTFATTLY